MGIGPPRGVGSAGVKFRWGWGAFSSPIPPIWLEFQRSFHKVGRCQKPKLLFLCGRFCQRCSSVGRAAHS
jgi:hypothetical protein